MSYEFYRIVHLTAIMMIFLSLGGATVNSLASNGSADIKKFAGMVNGIALLLAAISGFGIMGKLGIGFDGWVLVKMLIWVIMGGLLAVINRKPELCKPVWVVVILLGAAAAYLGGLKPF